jgi:hypothetical protein
MLIAVVALANIVGACSAPPTSPATPDIQATVNAAVQQALANQPTTVPTWTPEPTWTPSPIATPTATLPPIATPTPTPTATPRPTATPTPTDTRMLQAKSRFISYLARCAQTNDDPKAISDELFDLPVGEFVTFEPSFGTGGAWLFIGPGTEWFVEGGDAVFRFAETNWAVSVSSIWPTRDNGVEWWSYFCRDSITGETID